MKNAEKPDNLKRAISTSVLTNSVFLFGVALKFAFLKKKSKSTPKNKTKEKQKQETHNHQKKGKVR